jgi:ribosomal protein L21E
LDPKPQARRFGGPVSFPLPFARPRVYSLRTDGPSGRSRSRHRAGAAGRRGPSKEFHLMFRKCFAAVVALMLVAGGLFAEEIKAVFKKFEEGKVTVTVDEKEKTYKVDPDATVKFKTKGGEEKEFKVVDSFRRYKEGDKVTLTVKDDVVTGAKREFMRKKKTDN